MKASWNELDQRKKDFNRGFEERRKQFDKAAKQIKNNDHKFDVDPEYKSLEKSLKDLESESWNPVEEAFFENKLTIYVEAKYKYGTKVFEVFSATPETIKLSRIDKTIFNEVKTSVNRMKNNGFSVREDLTLEAYKEIKLANSLLEDMNFLL